MSSVAEKYVRPDVIRKVSKLDLKARLIVEGFFSGLHASPYHGFSVEFSEHRKYVPGDDIRLIDWSVYAKTERYYVKKYQAETNMRCHLIVDASNSMGYSSSPASMSKMDYSICCAAALAFLMIRQQDSVGVVTFDTKIRGFLEPKSKPAQLSNLLSILSRTQVGGETDVGSSLIEIGNLIPKRGLVVVFSDLLSDPEKVIKGLQYLRFRGHDLIVFHILDPAELRFPFHDPSKFEDTETGRQIQVDAGLVRSEYLRHLGEFMDRYEKSCHSARMDYVRMDTSDSFDRTLVAFLARRSAMK